MKKTIIALLVALILLACTAPAALADLPCVACGSSGKVDCGNCSGGWVLRGTASTGYVRSLCSSCGGSGKVNCRACGGDGRVGSSDPGTSSGGGSGQGLNKTRLTLVVGHSEQLSVSGASGAVKWSSSNTNVARVNGEGLVKARKAGTCTITARMGGKKLKCQVTVKKRIYAKSIKLDRTKATPLKGETFTLTYALSPDTSTITEDWSVTFSSSNKSVAKVDKSGKVTAKKAGSATITAKLKVRKAGSMRTVAKAKCKIKVSTDGPTLFKSWFKANRVKEDGEWVASAGDGMEIIHDVAAGTWTFKERDDDVYVSITFNENFTGKAKLDYNYCSWPDYGWLDDDILPVVNYSGSVACKLSEITPDAAFKWKWETNYGSDKADDATNRIRSLLSRMDAFLRNTVGLTAKGGWRDLGLKKY